MTLRWVINYYLERLSTLQEIQKLRRENNILTTTKKKKGVGGTGRGTI